MASLEKLSRNGRLRWYARYPDPAGSQLVTIFDRRVGAEHILTTVEASTLFGSYVEGKRASITFQALAAEHRAAHAHNLASDSTRVVKRSRLERHILPVLGDHPVGAVRPNAVTAVKAPTAPRRYRPGPRPPPTRRRDRGARRDGRNPGHDHS